LTSWIAFRARNSLPLVAMSTAERNYHGPFTVDDFRAIIHRRLREMVGLALIAAACGAAAALAQT